MTKTQQQLRKLMERKDRLQKQMLDLDREIAQATNSYVAEERLFWKPRPERLRAIIMQEAA